MFSERSGIPTEIGRRLFMNHIAQRKQRWNNFFDWSTGHETQVLFQIQYSAPYLAPPPPLHPGFKQERIEFAWRRYLEQLERTTWLEDDTIPNFLLMSGTVIFSEPHGGMPYYSPTSYRPGARPIIFSPEDVKKIQIPRLEDSSLILYCVQYVSRRHPRASCLKNKNRCLSV